MSHGARHGDIAVATVVEAVVASLVRLLVLVVEVWLYLQAQLHLFRAKEVFLPAFRPQKLIAAAAQVRLVPVVVEVVAVNKNTDRVGAPAPNLLKRC